MEGKMIPHTDLIRSSPWNQMEGKDLGSRVWVGGEGKREPELGLSTGSVRERVERREGVI